MRLEGLGLGYRYDGGEWLFRDVHIALQQGEIVGLTGPSGAGKTTLGRLLAGLLAPQEGEVRIGGARPPMRGAHPVQMVLQHPEQAVNPRWLLARTLREAWQPGDGLLGELGIAREWLERYPNELSGGQLQRLCIARAVGPATRYLIADEMTTMLDAVTQAHIWQAVLRLVRARGLGMLVISHDPHLIRRLCDREIAWPK